MTEFSEQYEQLSSAQARQKARRALEAAVAEQLTRVYGRVWSKGKIAVRASKMVDESMRAGNAENN